MVKHSWWLCQFTMTVTDLQNLPNKCCAICNEVSHKPLQWWMLGAMHTFPKLPFPRTLMKLKLLRLTRALLFTTGRPSSSVTAVWCSASCCMMPASPAAAVSLPSPAESKLQLRCNYTLSKKNMPPYLDDNCQTLTTLTASYVGK